jgi:hypothetical protein
MKVAAKLKTYPADQLSALSRQRFSERPGRIPSSSPLLSSPSVARVDGSGHRRPESYLTPGPKRKSNQTAPTKGPPESHA